MRKFDYKRAGSYEEAAELIKAGGAVMAGGSDILGGIKHNILKDVPETLVSLKGIPDSEGIIDNGDTVTIKAMTTLTQIAESDVILEKLPIVAEAAKSVATPLVRNIGTIGGNLCQDVRCWFYRYPHEVGGRLECARKGGDQCYGILGDNRYHSIFGGMKTGATPCQSECPAGTDIPGYMQKLRENDWDGAAEIILKVNPMPMLTARVCPHNCQMKCNQCNHGDSVSIHSVERALGDYILAHPEKFYKVPETETGRKTSIVGGGPAGLTAAYLLRREGHSVTIYEKMEEAGGVLMYGIPEYRLPKHYVRDLIAAIKGMGVEFVLNTEVGKDITIEEIEAASDTVFIDTGAWKQPILGLDGEELTQFGLNFLVEVKGFIQRQIDRNVLVCGGGNVAMDVALTAKRLGAEKVTLVCLEQRFEMPASEEEIARAEEEGVLIFNGRGLHKVVYEGSRIVGMETNKCTSVFNEKGRFDPQYDNSDLQLFEADSIILATGQRVDIDFLGEKFRDEIKSARGLIEVGEHNETRKPGVYAGGDVATGPSLAIDAVRSGRNAARNMSEYMGYPVELYRYQAGPLFMDETGAHKTKALVEKDTPVGERTLDVEDSTTLSAQEAIEEAGRCMNCGCYSVNASDLSPVMVALGATLVTTTRKICAKEFFTANLKAYDMLEPGEIITAVEIPVPDCCEMHYDKFRLRSAVDFAMVSLASTLKAKDGVIEDAHLVLGGVAPVPLERKAAEEFLKGSPVSAETAAKAADLALEGARPFEKNEYKIQIAKEFVKEAIMRLA